MSKYMIGAGGGPDYLHLDPEAAATTESTDSSTESASTDNSAPSENSNSTDSVDLAELSGSDDYVSVTTIVDSVFWVNKDEANAPDMKGKLIHDSVKEGVIFVVEDGVKHPYLEEGRKFQFSGVKDYYYKKNDEVQVKITSDTDFTDMGKPHSTSSSSSSTSSTSRKSRKSLDKIAEEKLGGEEFTVSQKDEDSAVGKAKKRARDQGRDPAIDPHFQKDD